MRSAPGIGRISTTRATTTPARPPPTCSTASTTSPSESSSAPSAATPSASAASTPRGVNSLNQESGTRTLLLVPSSVMTRLWHSEPGQEAHVVLDEGAHVLDPVTHDRDTVDAEPEGEARPDLGIDAGRLEHRRVDEPAAAELDPADPGTGPATHPPQIVQEMSNSADGSVNGK